MYKILVSIFVFFAVMIVASCGDKYQNGNVVEDSTNVTFSPNDSVIYGLAGAECTDSILDFISPGKDPQYFDIVRARKRGRIIGNFDIGNHIAVVLSPDKKRVVKAIDLSALVGRWIKTTVDEDTLVDGFILGIDGSASTISKYPLSMYYTKWDILDANLVLTKKNIYDSAVAPKFDTLDIVCLEADTMVLKNINTRKRIKYVVTESMVNNENK